MGRKEEDAVIDAPFVPCQILNGKIVPPTALELAVSDHCNVACRQCNHGSPGVRKWNIDPEDAYRDLSVLAKVYRPRILKIIGGEPLLHPRLGEVVAAARRSRISEHLLLITNGMLLNRMGDDVWREIDEIEISRYPTIVLDEDSLARVRAKGQAFKTKITTAVYSDFRRTFSKGTLADPDLTRRIFAACKIANIWGCHAVYRGRIYRCPQSVYAPVLAGEDYSDGLPLRDGPDFQRQLLEFLNGREPLHSCRHCVGTNGSKFTHELMSRSDWAADLNTRPEDIIDYELLAQSLEVNSHIDDCRVPIRRKKRSLAFFRNLLQKPARN